MGKSKRKGIEALLSPLVAALNDDWNLKDLVPNEIESIKIVQ